MEKFMLISGNAHPKLVNNISSSLDVPIGNVHAYCQLNNEISVCVDESVRGRDVFIVQGVNIHGSVNTDIMEALLLNYSCRTSAARSVTLVLPYLPYSTQSRLHGRSGIPMSVVSRAIEVSGANRVVSIDMYRKELQGFFKVPVENLRASPFLIQAIIDRVRDYQNSIFIAANTNALSRATAFCERLKLGAHGKYILKRKALTKKGRMSPPHDRVSTFDMIPNRLPPDMRKQKQPLRVEGDVNGRIAIIVDDILDEVDRHVQAAQIIKKQGAYKIYVVATHGLLSGDAAKHIEDSPIDEVIVTNTVPHDFQKMKSHKIHTVDISPLISEAIRRIVNGESMGALFANVVFVQHSTDLIHDHARKKSSIRVSMSPTVTFIDDPQGRQCL
uniref:ribose-phosphate diphosphokinase n=1 Tax=Panagrellus redivivus TaxID=6233 RepID=A0A7E4W2W3_PANRE